MSIESFEKLKEEKKNSIYISAIREFSQYGYNDANTIRITAESGISKGSLFNYFGSKKGCFLYILNKAVDKILSKIECNVKGITCKDLFECIALMLQAKVNLYTELPLEMNFIIGAFSEKSIEIREELDSIALKYAQKNEELRYERFIELLEALDIRDEIKVDDAYSVIISILDTYTMKILKKYQHDISSFFNNPETVLEELKGYLDIIKYGILKG